MTNTSTPSPRISRRAFAHGFVQAFTFVAVTAVAGLLLTGCGGRNRDGDDRGDGRGGTQSIAGQWTATLNPDTAALEVPLTINADRNGNAVTGQIAGTQFDSGSTAGGGSTGGERTIQFTTGAITTPGPAEEQMTVDGPLNWSATMRDGMLDGTVTGPDGRAARWTARRS